MSEEIINIRKIKDNLYEYDLKSIFQTTVESLNNEKASLEKRLVRINYLITEIEKIEKP